MQSNIRVVPAGWSNMTIIEQMGNIGAEVGRTFAAEQSGDEVRLDGALSRALELFGATSKQLAAEKSPRLKEILRAKEGFLSALVEKPAERAGIERYFMQFAIAARSGR